MNYQEMTLEEAYRNRQGIEQAGQVLYYINSAGQRLNLHLAAAEEIQYGTQFPVLIERQDGQLMRKYLPRIQKVCVEDADNN